MSRVFAPFTFLSRYLAALIEQNRLMGERLEQDRADRLRVLREEWHRHRHHHHHHGHHHGGNNSIQGGCE